MPNELVDVIASPEAAIVALDPVRSRLLSELREPRSSSELARILDLPRQRVNYHVRQLEQSGLVTVSGERRWGGITERLLVATAGAYLVSPEALGAAAALPASGERADRLSASYLVALAGRTVREAGALLRRSRESGRRTETLAIDAEVTFATPQARADFARDLAEAVTAVIACYHDERAPAGRRHRLVLGTYPVPEGRPPPEDEPQADPTSQEAPPGAPTAPAARSRA